MTEWKKIKGYGDKYFISSKGDVKNDRDMLLKTNIDKDGYKRVSLSFYVDGNKIVKTVYIHRLVAEAFIENPHNYKYVERKNADKLDNFYKNLIWSEKRNTYRNQSKIVLKKSKQGRAVRNIDTGMEFKSINEAAKNNSISAGGIYNCCIGRNKTSGGFRWEFIDICENLSA